MDSKDKAERQRLETAIASVVQAWASIEYALTRTLSHCIGEEKNHYLASAILFGVTGLEARLNIVRRVIHSTVMDNPDKVTIKAFSDDVLDKLGKKKNLRNEILHGCITTVKIHGKSHLRITGTAGNHYDLTRKFNPRQLPGHGANDLEVAVKAMDVLFVDVQKPGLLICWRRAGRHEEYSELLAELKRSISQTH